jgi:hypothetical protein
MAVQAVAQRYSLMFNWALSSASTDRFRAKLVNSAYSQLLSDFVMPLLLSSTVSADASIVT